MSRILCLYVISIWMFAYLLAECFSLYVISVSSESQHVFLSRTELSYYSLCVYVCEYMTRTVLEVIYMNSGVFG